MASSDGTSRDSTKAAAMDAHKSESIPISAVLPATSHSEKLNTKKSSAGFSNQSHLVGGDKSRIKRPYNKKRIGDFEKPPPRKRGRKSKHELSMVDIKQEDVDMGQMSTKVSRLKKSPSQQKISRKASAVKAKKTSVTTMGPSVFDKKILAGPHLTMKQVLEYIITDHSYCVPPDPLPAVSSNHQMIRSILGPKNESKPRALQMLGMIDSSDRSPITMSSFSRSRGQLSLSSTPPTSKLENLLKRGDVSPGGLSSSAMRYSHIRNASECRDESDVEIDIETVEQEKRVPYDVNKAIDVMKECEKYVEFARSEDTGDDWETKILKTGWTKAQTGLFDKIISALHAERLARLTYKGIGDTEPVLRRASIDRTASRVRRIFGEYLWDSKLTQWLHSVLTESLNYDYLAVYLDVLQTLKSRCPQLVSRILTLSVSLPLQQAGRDDELVNLLTPFLEPQHEAEVLKDDFVDYNVDNKDEISPSADHANMIASTSTNDHDSEIYLPERSVVPQMKDVIKKLNSAKHAEALKALLERQWDPFSPVLLHRMKKLASNPVFLLIAPSAIHPKHSLNRRLRQYHDMFRRLGKIVTVSSRISDARNYTSASHYMEKIMYMAREKVRTIRSTFPDRPLYVVGWGSGSILAARLSNMVGPVDGIVALGFPLHSLKRMQDDLYKVFSGLKHPILFVIGGLASNNSLTDMELFRRRLACETSLVVVGSGNDNLYVTRAHREKLFVTQSYVDKNVMDEIAYFVNLHSKHNQMSATITTNISMKPSFSESQRDNNFGKKHFQGMPRGRKRSISNTGFDVEAPKHDDRVIKPDGEREKFQEMPSSSPKAVMLKKEPDAIPKPSMNSPYEYDFDEPKSIPSNKSSNKRKAYSSRPNPTTTSSSTLPSSSLTASKLLQQSPNVKRRMSRPSGSVARAPLLQGQRSNPQTPDQIKDEPAGVLNYPIPQEQLSDIKQEPGVAPPPPLPIVLRQPDGGHLPAVTAVNITTKSGKKKSSSKAKAARVSKTSSTESPALALASAITDISTQNSSGSTTSTPASSLDMHKYVLQHQQMIKQLEQHRQDKPQPQTSQLFKLLSPAGDSDSLSPVSSLPYTSEYVKLKLIGSQPVTPSDLMAGDARTTVISKQNLVTNMALPMIRLSASKPEEGAQKPIIMTGASSLLTSLSAGEAGERIYVRATEKGLVKLNPAEVKNFIAGSRGIQVVSGITSLTPPVTPVPLNVLLKKSSDGSEPLSLSTESTATVSSASSNDASSIGLSEAPNLLEPAASSVAVNNAVANEPSLATVNEAISAAMNSPSPDKPIEGLSSVANLDNFGIVPGPSIKSSSMNSSTLPSSPATISAYTSATTASTILSGFRDLNSLEAESDSSATILVPITIDASVLQSSALKSAVSSLPMTKEAIEKVSEETQKLESATEENNSSKDDSNCNEDQVETEPEAADNDTDDEMSGLCISNTFSVCPNSGERVEPLPEMTSSTESKPTASKKSSKSKKPEIYRSKLRPRRSTSSFEQY